MLERIKPGVSKYHIAGFFVVLLFACLFAIMLNASSAKAAGDIDSGIIDETIPWRITSSGDLIFGKEKWEYYLSRGIKIKKDISKWSRVRTVKFSGTIGLGVTSEMFSGCDGIKSINLRGVRTGDVSDMSNMFYGCSSLMSIDLSEQDTINVNNMKNMFYGCSSLTSVNLSDINTRWVTNMENMFFGCSSLKNLDLSDFNTYSVTDMGRMFYGCSSLKSLNLSGMDTSRITYMWHMFEKCNNLQEVALGSKSILPGDTEIPPGEWTRYKNLNGATVTGPSFDDLSNYTGNDPGWYKRNLCPKGHTWDKGKITKNPTSKSEGIIVFTCTVCEEKKTERIPKLCTNGHTWDNGQITKKPTSSDEGVKTFTCIICGETKLEKINKLSQNINNTNSKTNSNNEQKTPILNTKAYNPLKVKNKTVKLKYKKLKKKNMTVKRAKAIKVTDAQGKVTYKLVSVKKAKFKKYFKVKKNGNITVKKKLKKGTYKLKIKVTVAGNARYKKATKTATVRIKVK